jgi:hypothetical protein
MKKIILLIFLFCFSNLYAQKYTLFGFIKDKSSGESLIGATISNTNNRSGTFSNNYGFYSLVVPEGDIIINCSYVGYRQQSIKITLTRNTNLNIQLEKEMTKLGEVIVKDNSSNRIINSETGSYSLDLLTMKKLPAIMGETDLIKTLQLLPGIQTSHEGTTNLSICGGSFDQNLFLLDDAPVYNPSHALGFFSVFNPDAIKVMKIYKVAFPAQYGGRLTSIIDVHMNEGNNNQFCYSGSVGLIASRLTVEGPILRGKSSFILSGRYSYAGFVANKAGSLGRELGFLGLRDFNSNNKINFYDFNAKMNFELNDRNHLYLSVYSGSDQFFYYAIDNNSNMEWGNVTGTARWNHVYSSKLFANSMFIISNYNYSYTLKDDARRFLWSSELSEIDLKNDFDFIPNPNIHTKFGISIEDHHYFPGKIEPRDSSSITKSFELDHQKSFMGNLYLNNEQQINEKILLVYGLRYTTFFLLGKSTVYSYNSDFVATDSTLYGNGEFVKFYHGLEPRITLRYLLDSGNSIKVSYNRTKQYQHLIGNSTIGFPSDVWIPANTYIKPQFSDQFNIGYYKITDHNAYEFSLEMYYRDMHNIIDYKDNADLFLNPHIETQILVGKGKSYGIEFYLKKNLGKLNGWLSYTLSKTTRQINGINYNQPYPAGYDKRHNLSIVLNYELTSNWSLSSVFKLTSGGYVTIPVGTFNYYGSSFNYYSKRNGYQLPYFHQLDLSMNYKNHKDHHRKLITEWNFGIYNVYNRKNIFALFIKQENNDLSLRSAYKMYLFGITPFVNYNFKF